MCPCLLLLDLRRLALSLRLLVVWFRKNLILLVLRFPDRRVMDFKIFTLKITGKRTGTKPRKRRTLRRLVISLH
jgi:hypothetical protein